MCDVVLASVARNFYKTFWIFCEKILIETLLTKLFRIVKTLKMKLKRLKKKNERLCPFFLVFGTFF